MPIQADRASELTFRVTPSAALELMWVLHNGQAEHVLEGSLASMEPVRVAYRDTLWSFWDDQVRGFTEMVVLAHRTGSMLDLDLDGFFVGAVRAAASDEATPSLLSESPAERKAVGKRLDLLRADPKARARYVALLKEIWDSVRVEWLETGRPAVVAAAREWQQRLNAGTPYMDVLERKRLWPGRPDLDELAEADAAEGRLVLSPGWFFGDIHVVELDGTMYAGRGIRSRDDDADRRHVAKYVSASIKAFADPTRLAILLWLARQPASVTEIARQFNLSQPTVSAHVQVLRAAGVLDERPDGRSARLSTTEQNVRRVLEGAADHLAGQIRAQRPQR